MATIRAQRLFNSVVSGVTNAAALQSLLGNAANRADWQQALVERGKARLLTNNSVGAPTTFQSELALVDYLASPACSAEFALSATSQAMFAQFGVPTIAASSALMDSWFASSSSIDMFRGTRSIGQPLIQSAFFPAKVASTPLASGSTWRMPYCYQQNATINAWESDWNGTTIVTLNQNSANSSSSCAVSTNSGVTYSQVQVSASIADPMRSIAFGAGLFVIVGDNGRIWTSPTGLAGSWTLRTSGTTLQLSRVRYANGVFVVVGSGGIALRSTDGITWTTASGFGAAYSWSGLTYTGSNTWVACATNWSQMARSTDNGASWSFISAPFSNNFAMDYGDGYVVVGGPSGNIAVSTNRGTTWATAFNPSNGISGSWGIYGVAYWNGLWCISNYAGGGNCFCSTAPTQASNFFSQSAGGANLVPGSSDIYSVNGLQVRNGRLFVNHQNGTNLWIAWNN